MRGAADAVSEDLYVPMRVPWLQLVVYACLLAAEASPEQDITSWVRASGGTVSLVRSLDTVHHTVYAKCIVAWLYQQICVSRHRSTLSLAP